MSFIDARMVYDSDGKNISNKIGLLNDSINDIAYNVKNYGATGGGTVDDSPAIQKALDVVHALGGGTVIIPNGTYLINTVMQVHANTTIEMSEGTTLVNNPTSPAYRVFINGEHNNDNYATGYDGDGNIIIRGGTIDSSGLTRVGISFAHAKNILIEDVTIKNVTDDHCIELAAINQGVVRNCRFMNWKNVDTDNRYYVEAVQCDVMTSGAFPSFGSYDNTVNKEILIENCYFGSDATAQPGFGAYASGFGTHSSIMGNFNNNITVRDCTFDGMTYTGIRCPSYQDVNIDNNKFYNCARAIIVNMNLGYEQEFKSITIEDNVLYNCGIVDDAIQVNGSSVANGTYYIHDVLIKGNRIYGTNTAYNAISTRYCDGVIIEDNYADNSRRLYYASYSNAIDVNKNRSKIGLYDGIFIAESTDVKVNNNRFEGCGSQAILIRSTQIGIITNNRVIDSGTGQNGAIQIYTNSGSPPCSQFLIHDNIVTTGSANTKSLYGLYITTDSTSIHHSNNLLVGATGPVYPTGSDDVLVYRPDGTLTAISVDNTNTIQINTTS